MKNMRKLLTEILSVSAASILIFVGFPTSTLASSAESALTKTVASKSSTDGLKALDTVSEKTYTQSDVAGLDNIVVSGNVIFDNVNFTAKSGSAIIVSGTANITIKGTCSFEGAENGAGIEVLSGNKLTLTGDTLTVIGNAGNDSGNSGGSGIGGTHSSGDNGAVNITGLSSLTAKGCGHHASGIGSCEGGSNVGGITITDSTITLARGGFAQQNITSSYGKSDPEGGTAIGGGAGGGSAGVITINNSTIESAQGGSKCAAIGAGYWGGGADITIKNSVFKSVVGGCTAAAIGLSRVNASVASKTASVSIIDSKVTAQGGDYGSAIGAGYNDGSVGNGDKSDSKLGHVTVSISGGKINATGGAGGAGIGGGYKGHNVDITISGGADVTAIGGVLGSKFDSGKVAKEEAGASGIGTGANGSGVFYGGKISISDGCSVTAFSNGDKWAIDSGTTSKDGNCDVSGVKASVIQLRFERPYGSVVPVLSDEKSGTEFLKSNIVNNFSLGGGSAVGGLPESYFCFATTAGGTYAVSAGSDYSPVYASCLKRKQNVSTASADFNAVTGISSFDDCAFRPGTVPATYTVKFVDYDGTTQLSSKSGYLYGDKVSVPSSPARASDGNYTYKFMGWSTDGTATLENIPDVSADATYIAVYKAESVSSSSSDATSSSSTITIGDDPVPMADGDSRVSNATSKSGSSSGSSVTIDDDITPLSSNPETGGSAMPLMSAVFALAASAGVFLIVKKKK